MASDRSLKAARKASNAHRRSQPSGSDPSAAHGRQICLWSWPCCIVSDSIALIMPHAPVVPSGVAIWMGQCKQADWISACPGSLQSTLSEHLWRTCIGDRP